MQKDGLRLAPLTSGVERMTVCISRGQPPSVAVRPASSAPPLDDAGRFPRRVPVRRSQHPN
jgi:hypothetical protein